MSMESALAPVQLNESAQSLRTTLDLLLWDMAPKPVNPATVQWDQPIFVLRSANMGRMQALLDDIVAHGPTPQLHIMSHARDEQTLRDMAPCDFTFHAYPTPGRYRLEEVPAAGLERLRAVEFKTLFFLDTGIFSDLFDEVERLLAAVAETGIISFNNDGTYTRPPQRRLHQQAESAFLRLIEWYQFKLDPEFPDGPVRPASREHAA
jgi:hypothetical protein